MKKVIAMLALVALTGNIASAELLKNFKYDGKIEVNAWQMNDRDYVETTTDKRNDVDTRVQLNMGFDLNEDVNAVVSAVKANRQAGDASEDMNDVQNNVLFEQAYINLKGVLGLDHKLGRQYYGNEGDLNVYYGPQSWPFMADHAVQGNALSVSGIDGWSSAYNWGKWNFGAVLAKIDNNQAAADTDEDLTGITAKYDLMEDLKLGGYAYRYNAQAGANAGPNDHLDTIGVKADGKFMGVEYNAEVAKNMGLANENVHQAVYGLANAFYLPNNTTGDYSGMAFKANVKYGIDLLGKLSFMGEYAMGSGDDDATDDKVEGFMAANSDYRPGIIWGGNHLNTIGGNGLSNLTTFNVGAMWNPSKIEKLTIGAKYFNFAPTEAPAAYDVYGNELDLCANWKHSENVGVKAYYAMFMPDSDYAATVTAPDSDDATSVLGAAFTVKF
ncbi:MAG: hypothetical protein A2049_08100 [Elusimicrobia bacterium GWA2_62_23]|nr:MAG: hypothetical protein A2049_08100 [Elusimicrobia bacterium GWA2_62_23]